MSSFILECDGSDGLLLIDKDNLSQLSPRHLAAFNILLDRDGKTELHRDFPSEAWSDVWSRESELIRAFLNHGKGVLTLIGGGDHECRVSIDNALATDCSSCIYLPTGTLIAVSASEAIQCLTYPDLPMDVPFQEQIDSGYYAVKREFGLTFRLVKSTDPKRSCQNVLM